MLRKALEAIGFKVLNDNATHRNRIEFFAWNESDRCYVMAQDKAKDTWHCNCPGQGLFSRIPCKHLRAFRPILKALSDDEPLIEG